MDIHIHGNPADFARSPLRSRSDDLPLPLRSAPVGFRSAPLRFTLRSRSAHML